jgi:hypothetical protein
MLSQSQAMLLSPIILWIAKALRHSHEFIGLVGWRANKQDTVTISTTEVELLALSQAAKEGQYISRSLQELTVQLDQHRIEI